MSKKLAPVALAAALMAAGIGGANASSLNERHQGNGMAILEGVEATYLNDAAIADVRGELDLGAAVGGLIQSINYILTNYQGYLKLAAASTQPKAPTYSTQPSRLRFHGF